MSQQNQLLWRNGSCLYGFSLQQLDAPTYIITFLFPTTEKAAR
jgi:hypothetical protein